MKAVLPRLALVGRTVYVDDGLMELDASLDPDDPAHLIERAGRGCYNSFHKPNPATRTNADYIEHILDQNHTSVVEHAQFSFYVTGVSRDLLLELERHRHTSLSVISMRYVDVDEANLGFVAPPAFKLGDVNELKAFHAQARDLYRDKVSDLAARGFKRKEAREAARSFLPGSTETRFVLTANARGFMEILQKRDDPAADAEMQRFAGILGDELAEELPGIFDGAARDHWGGNHNQGAAK